MNTRKTDTILLSIHPTHVQNILHGVKRFELRRRIPLDVKRFVIYATAPESRIVAVAEVEEVICDTPNALWKRVRGAAGVEHGFFCNYFAGSDQAFALRIGRIRELTRKIQLTHSRLHLSPPQSFCYMDTSKVDWLLDCTEPMLSGGTRKIFVGGVHASGKGFLCENVISSYGYHCVSASTLIRMGRGEVSLDKSVSDIQENQRCLLRGLEKIQQANTHMAIDGHFCLLDKKGLPRRIPFETFEAINPELIILATPMANIVQKRLNKRETPIHLKDSLEGFMKKELQYAKYVAKRLAVRLELLDTGMNIEELHNKIRVITSS